MNLTSLWISMGVMGMCLYLAFGSWQAGRTHSHDFQDILQKANMAQTSLGKIKALGVHEPIGIEDSYKRLYKTMHASAHLIDAKLWVELINAKDSSRVIDALLPSRFIGVDVLSVKLSFSEVSAPEGYIKVLKDLGDLQKVLPMEIIKIDGFDKNIEMFIDLFGQSRRV